MPIDPKILPPELRATAADENKRRSLRDSMLFMLMRLRGNRYTTKAIVDLYFRLAAPITRVNLWKHRLLPKRYPEPVKLNIGSGPQYLKGFLNIEGFIPWKKDLWLDVRYGLPFKDASVDVVYSCHVFEHFDLETLKKIFAECYRVLKPGGRIRFVTPSLNKAIEAYIKRDLDWFITAGGSDFKSLGGRFNELMLCQNHHLILPNFDFFEELLLKTGGWEKLMEGTPSESDALTQEELAMAEGSRFQVISASLVVEATKAAVT